MPNDAYALWEEYKKRELAKLAPLLAELGYTLDADQPHVSGERYLMQAVTTMSGRKLILLGRRTRDNTRVVIKATRAANGARELTHERACREVLHRIDFAHGVFFSPQEILFTQRSGYTISIQAFIEQEKPFLVRTTEEQFAFALKAFKAQESARATTSGHERLVEKTFGIMRANDYLRAFAQFVENISREAPSLVPRTLLDEANTLLVKQQETIEQYCGFLTHTDFVPHNFRIVDGNIYLLDNSSLRFGNKYEGWARFLNFMTLYNPELERALVEYVRVNRTREESLALKLMRVYRLGEIIWYYVGTLSSCSGDLRLLNEERVRLWTRVLEAQLHDSLLPASFLDDYRAKRDTLRSDEEKRRQQGLH